MAVPVADVVEESHTSLAPSSAESHLTGFGDVSSLSFRSPTGCLEDRHPGGAAPFQVSYSTTDTLRRFLSSENITSDRPLISSPTTIRSLYYHVESMNQLEMLDFKMLTLLMGLFGSLSIDPHTYLVYRVPLASHLLRASTYRTHWAFVLKVGKHKSDSGMVLQDSDRFWLMCAELAMAQPNSEPLSDVAYSAILRARTHYHIIRRHSRRPDVHAYYLEALLAIQDPRLFDLAARDFAFLLRTHPIFHPRLQRLLFRLVVQHGRLLSTRSQEVILTALWSRARQGTSDLVLEDGLSKITFGDCTLDTKTIALSLTATLFGFAGHLPRDNSASLLRHLLSVFSPVYPHPLRWSSLTVLSNFNFNETPYFNGTHCASNHAMPPVTSCWQVIYSLAAVEKVTHSLSLTFAMQRTRTKVLEATRNLLQLWLMIVKSRLVSRDFACAITTSFLKITSVLADPGLFLDCRELFHAGNSSEGSQTSVQKLFVAQYIAAAVRVQSPLSEVVLTALETFSLDSKLQLQALASAVEALAPIDPSLAYTLYTFVQGKEKEMDYRITHILAMSFAKRGALHQAILLNGRQFSVENRGILISAIACSLRENPRTRHPQGIFISIANELAALYHSHVPPEHFRGHLERLLVVLARHGRGSQLLPVVLSIFGRIPSYLRSRFFSRYCRVLLRHKQYATVGKLLDAIAAVHPKIARSLLLQRDRMTMRAKTFRVLKQDTSCRGPSLLRLSSRLRSCPFAGPPLERSLQELLRSGRVLAAKHIFACAAVIIPSTRCTTLGNILLHGVSRQPTPRNGRRVRKVLALLENLVEHYGFRPDRVTANILIRVMISWRSPFNSPRLRELFDQLVRSGYPAADYSPLHPPFGTRLTQSPGLSGNWKLSPFVSFEKHSRPMFKMFIQAFYMCNDVEAARRVVGILKVEEHKNAMAREARQRARTKGRIKTAQRNVVPLDATAPPID